MAAIRVVVSGYVQGVGFRYYVTQCASSLGVDGEVWNRADRKVEAVAEHYDPAVLEEFTNLMWEGPGRVDDVSVEPTTGGYVGFSVSRTR